MKKTYDTKTLITVIFYILSLIVPTIYQDSISCNTRLLIVSITSFISIALIVLFKIIETMEYDHALNLIEVRNDYLEKQISKLEEDYKNQLLDIEKFQSQLNELQNTISFIKSFEDISQIIINNQKPD